MIAVEIRLPILAQSHPPAPSALRDRGAMGIEAGGQEPAVLALSSVPLGNRYRSRRWKSNRDATGARSSRPHGRGCMLWFRLQPKHHGCFGQNQLH